MNEVNARRRMRERMLMLRKFYIPRKFGRQPIKFKRFGRKIKKQKYIPIIREGIFSA
jgi:hypothetical protein